MRSRKNYRKITKKRKYKKLGRNYKNSRRSTTKRQYKKLKKSRKYTRKGNYKNKKLVIRRNRVMKGGAAGHENFYTIEAAAKESWDEKPSPCKYYDYAQFNGQDAGEGICTNNNGFNRSFNDGTKIGVLCQHHYNFIIDRRWEARASSSSSRRVNIKKCSNASCYYIYLNSFKQQKKINKNLAGINNEQYRGWCGYCIIIAIGQASAVRDQMSGKAEAHIAKRAQAVESLSAWYRPKMNKQDAEKMFKNPENDTGSFVVRSSRQEGKLTLSIKDFDAKSRNYLITQSDNNFILTDNEVPTTYDSLEKLVKAFREKTIRSEDGTRRAFKLGEAAKTKAEIDAEQALAQGEQNRYEMWPDSPDSEDD